MLSGFGVFALGRQPPRGPAARCTTCSTSTWPTSSSSIAACWPALLAERLLAGPPHLHRVYFCNSGTEAVEAALKFARYATGRPRVIYCRPRLPRPDHRLAVGQRRGRVPDAGSTRCCPTPPSRSATSTRWSGSCAGGDVAALIVEPMQGKGVWVAPPGFLAEAADLLHDHGALLICDEVQTGIGRTGELFGYQHDDVSPTSSQWPRRCPAATSRSAQ